MRLSLQPKLSSLLIKTTRSFVLLLLRVNISPKALPILQLLIPMQGKAYDLPPLYCSKQKLVRYDCLNTQKIKEDWLLRTF